MDQDVAALEERVRADLAAIQFPNREWVLPRQHASGAHVYDVLVIGAGHGGLGVAFALMRRRITNTLVLDAAEEGRQGPWQTYGRMLTLRSSKHMNGPDGDVPSLTCEAWYRARYGSAAWDCLNKLPTSDWQEYLRWFRRVLELPVRYRTRVELVTPEESGVIQLDTTSTGGQPGEKGTYYARKVVFATGAEGTATWSVPEIVSANLPPEAYVQVAEELPAAGFAGKRVVVLGGGASAYDNAAVALEQGASRVDLFFRRPQLHRVNPHKWTEFAGFLEAFRDLDDPHRWAFMSYILPMNEPPPPETFHRATRHPGFRLHLGEAWLQLRHLDGVCRLTTDADEYEADLVMVAIGLRQDLAAPPELAVLEPHIARWADVYLPPADQRNDDLARFPYLGPDFEYVERNPGEAPYLRNIYNFTAAATVSHGPSGASINGVKQAIHRVAAGVCRSLFLEDADRYLEDLLKFDEPELDVPWPA